MNTACRAHLGTAVVVGVLLAWTPVALALDPEKAVHQYVQQRWDIEDGLPQATVVSIEQTSAGYLWLSSFEGMARFDGVDFEIFDHTNTPALKSNGINEVFEDSRGTLWVGTMNSGLLRRVDGEFVAGLPGDGGDVERVYSFAESSDGTVWASTPEGVLAIRDGAVQRRLTVEDGLPHERVIDVIVTRDGDLWFATRHGPARIRGDEVTTFEDEEAFPPGVTLKVYEDRSGDLWFGTRSGVVRLREGRFEAFSEAEGLADRSVIAIREDRDGNIWVGTYGDGLFRFDRESGRFRHEPGLVGDRIWYLFEDREANLWVGTSEDGLIRLRDGAFTPYTDLDGLGDVRASAIYQDDAGRLLVGTRNGTVNVHQGGRFEPFQGTEVLEKDVNALLVDRAGALWVGTENGGLHWFDGDEHRAYSADDGLRDEQIKAIVEDREGTLWLGSRYGVTRQGDDGFTTLTPDQGMPEGRVCPILEGRDGTIWMVVDGVGVVSHREGTFTTWTKDDGLSTDHLTSALEDSQGVLWIGTIGGGLNVLLRDRFHAVTSHEGLFDDSVFAILEDESRDELWMSSNKGIFRAPRQQLLDVASGERESVESTHYGTSDGMKSRECNGGFQPPAWKADDGRMWFPTVRGVVAVDPGHMVTNTVVPPVYVERVVVDREPLEPGSSGPLAASTSAMEFHYTAPSFADPDRVRYQTWLEGLDEGWVDVGTRRVAYYTSLPPGEYTFRVKACNNDGVWNEDGASFAFVKRPYFHQTVWFALLCAVLLAGVAVGAYRLKVRQIRRRQRQLEAFNVELRQEVDRQTQELQQQRDDLQRTNAQLEDALDEIRKAQAKMIHQARLAALGNLVAGVSHEIGNPLNVTLGGGKSLGKYLDEAQRGLERLQGDAGNVEALAKSLGKSRSAVHLIQDGNDRIKQILDNLRSFLTTGDVPVEPCDVAGTVDASLQLFRRRLEDQGIEVDLQLARLPTLPFRRGELIQVFTNLVLNSIEAMPEGGQLRIHGVASDQAIDIEVGDDGCGIPARHRSSIFDPFFTTKEPNEGTGLGLYIAHEIVLRHQGELRLLDSEEGARFLLRLPLEPSPGR